jgi:hypothetical protein
MEGRHQGPEGEPNVADGAYLSKSPYAPGGGCLLNIHNATRATIKK